MSASCVQVILAAGRSQRMGEPKALFRFGGRTVLERLLHAASGSASRALIVVAPGCESWRSAAVSGSPPLATEWVVNPDPASEQIDSLAVGLRRLEEIASAARPPPVAFFIQPVDYPLVANEDYEALARACEASREDAAAVFVPTCEGRRGHPVLCRRELIREFLDAAAAGKTARDVILRHAAVEVPAGRGVLEDMDTPADHARLLAAFRERETGRRHG